MHYYTFLDITLYIYTYICIYIYIIIHMCVCMYWNYSPKLRHGTGLIQKVAQALGDAPIDLGSRRLVNVGRALGLDFTIFHQRKIVGA